MDRTRQPASPMNSLQLNITLSDADRLKTSLSFGSGASGWHPLLSYDETDLSLSRITHKSQVMLSTLNQANRNGCLTPRLLRSLIETGQLLRDELLSPRLKEKVNQTDAKYMTVSMDERLVHIPWELLHDGRQFLCQRFAVGRLVQTRQPFCDPAVSRHPSPLRAMILADLDGSLPAAHKEAADIRNLIEMQPLDIRVMMRCADVNAEYLRTKIRNYDWVHFAGHADYGDDEDPHAGWRLSDGWLSAKDTLKMAGTGTMPALIFANACQSARTSAWSIDMHRQRKLFGLVNAFLLTGTRHFVGTSWEIPDAPGRHFALAFYQHLLAGATVGHAVCSARKALADAYGQEQVIWASYVLYGDPTYRYVDTEQKTFDHRDASSDPAKRQSQPGIELTRATRPAAAESHHDGGAAKTKGRWVFALLLLGCLATAAIWFVARPPLKDIALIENAQEAYRAGDFSQVMQLCPAPREGAQPLVGCLLLRGNIMFVQADLEGAERLYQRVRQSPDASSMDMAEALIGLGRIASSRGDHQQAIERYQAAARLSPRSDRPLVSLAMVNEQMGNDEKAVEYLNRAKQYRNADVEVIDAMHRTISQKISLQDDKRKTERIDRLIDKLTNMPPSEPSDDESDNAAHLPMGVWVMNMETSGYSLQEGVSRQITALIEKRLQEKSEFRVVDRHLMDRTLAELHVGASRLTEQQSRLQLGRLQSVRLMISGRMIFAGSEIQITLRCIDTESSRVVAVVVEAFPSSQPFSEMARVVTEEVLEKMNPGFT